MNIVVSIDEILIFTVSWEVHSLHNCHYIKSLKVTFLSTIIAAQIGFDPESYTYDEDAGVARLTITTNMPLLFTDATGALFYTQDGTATGGGGIACMLYYSVASLCIDSQLCTHAL